jgi:hypothetical protein
VAFVTGDGSFPQGRRRERARPRRAARSDRRQTTAVARAVTSRARDARGVRAATYPASISYMRMPSAHQSTALPCPLERMISGAARAGTHRAGSPGRTAQGHRVTARRVTGSQRAGSPGQRARGCSAEASVGGGWPGGRSHTRNSHSHRCRQTHMSQTPPASQPVSQPVSQSVSQSV